MATLTVPPNLLGVGIATIPDLWRSEMTWSKNGYWGWNKERCTICGGVGDCVMFSYETGYRCERDKNVRMMPKGKTKGKTWTGREY